MLSIMIGAIACSTTKDRPCVERAECFAGEYCSEGGVCRPYTGKTTTRARPDRDLGPVTLPDIAADLPGDMARDMSGKDLKEEM